MGQKVNPIGLRIGINRDWSSHWYAAKKDFPAYLAQDNLIRKYLTPKVKDSFLSRIDIDRVKDQVTVTIVCSRPGVVLGQEGANLKVLKEGLLKATKLSDVKISVVAVELPDLDANVVAQNLASQLEARASSRMAQKRAVQTIMRAGAKGCKTMISGRVNGAEIARSEQYREGVLSLHTLSQNIDYALCEAHTTYGRLGCKVWISLPSKEELEALARSRAQRDGRRFNNRGSRGGNNGRRDNRRPAKEAAKEAAPVADEKKGE